MHSYLSGMVLTFGEEAKIGFRILNKGGVKARNVRVVLSTEDPLLEVVQAEATFGDIEVGYFSGKPSDGGSFPQIRVVGEFSGVKQCSLSLDLYMDDIWIGRHDVQIEAVFSYVLSGRITDEEGNGLAGVHFSVQSTGGDEYLSFNIRTGEDGTFERQLPPGGYLFLRMSSAGGFAPQMFSFQVLEDKHLDVVLVKTFPVSGMVRDPEGNPLSGASLWSFPANTRTTTAQDGTYRLRLSRGRNSIQAERKSSDPALTFPPQTFEDVQVDGARRFDMTLRRGVRVAVQVVDEEGGGMGSIDFFASGSSLSDAQTDAEGMAVIALLPGVYGFHVFQPRAPYLGTTIPFLAISADTTVQIPLRKGFAISGSVRDESMEPFFSASLLFTPLDTDGLVSVRIADDGTYQTLLPPGRFQTAFFPTGPGSNTARSLGTIRIAGDGIFDFVVEPGIRIGGWLRDEEGRALSGKEILAHSAQTSVAGNARTLDDGSFEFFLKPGPYEFLASRDWTAFWYLGVFDVPPLDGFSFHLPVGASMSGRVFDAAGAPVHRALVVLTQDPRTLTVRAIPDPDAPPSFSYNGAGFAAAVVSEANGTFHVSVRPGTYTALVLPYFGRGIGVVRKEVSLSGKHIQDFVLPTFDALHQVYGRIVDEPDVPRGQVVLQFYDESTGIVGQTTNGNSRSYSMRLPPRFYQVRAGLFSPVQGFYQVYDVGGVEVEGDRRWDIRLSESATVVTETKRVLPECTILEQNYPNPFNIQTTIAYLIPQEGKVQLTIYNILGQPVRRLVDKVQNAGPHQVSWDARDKGGRMVGSGVYVYRLQAGEYQQIRRLVLLK